MCDCRTPCKLCNLLHFIFTLLCCCRDLDPDGVQLAATADPLGEAAKLVKRLCEHAADNLTSHLLAFEVRGAACLAGTFSGAVQGAGGQPTSRFGTAAALCAGIVPKE
jgi:hypothetical protein